MCRDCLLAIAQGKSRGDAFRIGYVAGLTHFLSSLYWLLLIPADGFSILGWVSLAAVLALFVAVWVWLAGGKNRRRRLGASDALGAGGGGGLGGAWK